MAKRLTKTACYKVMKEDYTRFYSPMPESWKALFPVLTVKDLEEMGLHFTVNHTGKMSGMQSLSTTCKCGNLCPSRIENAFKALGLENATDPKKALRDYIKEHPLATDVSICGFCFSDTLQDRQETMQIPLVRNFEILNGGIIHNDWLPVLNVLFFRGESFGDFASVNAVINFYNLSKKNPAVNFTAWTKNLLFFHKATEAGHNKPDNFKLVFSSQFINKQATIATKYRYLVNAVFTVYTEEFARLHNITINCGARACLACLRCYKGFEDGEIKVINELLK